MNPPKACGASMAAVFPYSENDLRYLETESPDFNA